MDNTRKSEKTFFVPLGFGGYLLTIAVVHVLNRSITVIICLKPISAANAMDGNFL